MTIVLIGNQETILMVMPLCTLEFKQQSQELTNLRTEPKFVHGYTSLYIMELPLTDFGCHVQNLKHLIQCESPTS